MKRILIIALTVFITSCTNSGNHVVENYLDTGGLSSDLKQFIETNFDSNGFVIGDYEGRRDGVIWSLDTLGFDPVFLAEVYIKALEDKEFCVRGYAAIKLHKMNHPYTIEACFRTMSDGCDDLHGYYSSPAAILSEIGAPVLSRLIDSLLSENESTRFSAAHAVGDAMAVLYGLELGNENYDDLEKWRKRWNEIGYDEDETDLDKRHESVLKLQHWFGELLDTNPEIMAAIQNSRHNDFTMEDMGIGIVTFPWSENKVMLYQGEAVDSIWGAGTDWGTEFFTSISEGHFPLDQTMSPTRIVFRLLKEEDDMFQIVFNENTGKTVWVMKESVEMMDWLSYLRWGEGVLPTSPTVLRLTPSDLAPEVPDTAWGDFRVLQMKGDWIEVEPNDHRYEPEDEKYKGWMRWTDGKNILVTHTRSE